MHECPARYASNVKLVLTETPQTANNDACNRVTSPTRASAKTDSTFEQEGNYKNKWVPQRRQPKRGLHKTSFHKSQTDDRMVMLSACSPSTQKKRLTVILLPFTFKFLLRTLHRTSIGSVRMKPSHSVFRNTVVTFLVCSNFRVLVLH